MLVSICVVVPFSLGTFFKHLPRSKPTPSNPCRTRPKPLTTTTIHCSSHFETLDCCQKDQIHLYVDTLLEWNQRMNLTAVREANEVMERHIEDSLAIIPPIKDSLAHLKVKTSALSMWEAVRVCPGWFWPLLAQSGK